MLYNQLVRVREKLSRALFLHFLCQEPLCVPILMFDSENKNLQLQQLFLLEELNLMQSVFQREQTLGLMMS